MDPDDSSESLPRRFPTTHWSRIAEACDLAAPGAREALASLCRSYWYPLYLFIRRQGYAADEARDLVQEYFVRLLDGPVLGHADRTKGRFRTFLIADCTRFLSHQRARAAPEEGRRSPDHLDRRRRGRRALPARAGPRPDARAPLSARLGHDLAGGRTGATPRGI